MQKTLRFFELDTNEDYFLADAAMLTAAGLDTEDALRATFGRQGTLLTLTLYKPTQGRQQEILRQTATMLPEGGYRQDTILLPSVRAMVMIERWEQVEFRETQDPLRTTQTVDADFYGTLHPLLANVIDRELIAWIYPVSQHPDFLKALAARHKANEDTKLETAEAEAETENVAELAASGH